MIFRAPFFVSCDTRVAHANAGFAWVSRKRRDDSARSSSTFRVLAGAARTAAFVLSAGKQNQYEKVQLFKSANVKTTKETSVDGSSNASPETTLRQSWRPASFCIATRSNALNRSNVLTLRNEPGMRMRPDARASPDVADHASNARRSSCAGEETSACVAHANCASTGTESSLRPKVSSLRRASSAQNVGSTALCQGSNRSTSVAGAPTSGGALGSDIAPNAASRELDARGPDLNTPTHRAGRRVCCEKATSKNSREMSWLTRHGEKGTNGILPRARLALSSRAAARETRSTRAPRHSRWARPSRRPRRRTRRVRPRPRDPRPRVEKTLPFPRRARTRSLTPHLVSRHALTPPPARSPASRRVPSRRPAAERHVRAPRPRRAVAARQRDRVGSSARPRRVGHPKKKRRARQSLRRVGGVVGGVVSRRPRDGG